MLWHNRGTEDIGEEYANLVALSPRTAVVVVLAAEGHANGVVVYRSSRTHAI